MALLDILPTIQSLPKIDKFRLVQFVLADLQCQEQIESKMDSPVWSPFPCDDAAAALHRLREEARAKS